MCESRAKRKENSRCYRGSSGDLCPQRAVQHFPAVLGDACCDGSAQCFNTSKSTVRFYFHILHSKWVDRELVASSIFSTLYFCHREGSNSLPSALLMLHVLILGIWQSIWFMRHNISTYRLWTSQCSVMVILFSVICLNQVRIHSVTVTDYQQYVEAADVCTLNLSLLLISSITPSMHFQLLIQIQRHSQASCPHSYAPTPW